MALLDGRVDALSGRVRGHLYCGRLVEWVKASATVRLFTAPPRTARSVVRRAILSKAVQMPSPMVAFPPDQAESEGAQRRARPTIGRRDPWSEAANLLALARPQFWPTTDAQKGWQELDRAGKQLLTRARTPDELVSKLLCLLRLCETPNENQPQLKLQPWMRRLLLSAISDLTRITCGHATRYMRLHSKLLHCKRSLAESDVAELEHVQAELGRYRLRLRELQEERDAALDALTRSNLGLLSPKIR